MKKGKNILQQLFSFKESQVDNQDELRIAELKIELNNLVSSYSYNVYKILNEILVLRQKQIRGYNHNTLSREEGINLSVDKVNYIFGFRFASPTSIKLIEDGKTNASLVLYLIRRGAIFRDWRKQDEVIKAVMEDKIKINQVSNISPKSILARIENGNAERGNDEFQVRMLQKVGRLTKEVEECKDMFDNRKMVERLKNKFNLLNNLVQKL